MQNSLTAEEKFIAGVRSAIDDWYNGCPKSLIFVKKILDLYKEYQKEKAA